MKHRHGKTKAVRSDLNDLSGLSLTDVTRSVTSGEMAPNETFRRVAPRDGTRVMVAASFNSAL